jgi:hypothetical protein
MRSIADPGRPGNIAQGVFTPLRETAKPEIEETNASPTYVLLRDDFHGAGAGGAHTLNVEPATCIEMRKGGEDAMSTTRADALRAEWRLLQTEHADLVQKTEALHGSGDGTALREHTQLLHAHVQRLHALMEALEEHHKTSGPIGGLSNLPPRP